MFNNANSYRTEGALLRIQRQRGVAAVEFAVILPVLIILLTFPIFFGRVFMNYSVLQKSAHDAAIYFATIPISEMESVNVSRAAEEVAASIANSGTEEISARSGSGGSPVIRVLCDDGPCGTGRPTAITVHIRMRLYDDLFNDFTWIAVGSHGILLESRVVVPYVGA